jgi:chaperonin GroES
MKITPIGERILLKPIKQEDRTASGIYLPESDDKKKEGEVVEVGTDKNGNKLPLNVGDKILYGGYSSEEFELENEKYLIVEFKDVVAKLGGE